MYRVVQKNGATLKLSNCCELVLQLVVDLPLAFDLLWICRTACCTACCTTNPQEVEASGVRAVGSLHSDGQKLTKQLVTNSLTTFFKLDH